MMSRPTRIAVLVASGFVGLIAISAPRAAVASSEIVRVRVEPESADATRAVPPRRGDLADGDVLDVDASGFEPDATGVARQCERAAAASCRNSYPVRFDDAGTARFQYRVVDEIDGPCRRCSVEVSAGGKVATVDVWFHEPAPAIGQLTVTPNVEIEPGDVLEVEVRSYPPGVDGEVVLCAAPAIEGAERCGVVGDPTSLLIGADGVGRAEFVIVPGEVGRERVACGRGSTCAVAVLVDGVAVASARPIEFAEPAGAEYQPARLIAGLIAAAALLLAAFACYRRTDWTPVGEVAAPEIDEAEYADLDAIIAALPPEPIEVGVHSTGRSD